MRRTIEYIKSKFEFGDKPTQQDFIDLIDSTFDSSAITASYSEPTSGDLPVGGLWVDLNEAFVVAGGANTTTFTQTFDGGNSSSNNLQILDGGAA